MAVGTAQLACRQLRGVSPATDRRYYRNMNLSGLDSGGLSSGEEAAENLDAVVERAGGQESDLVTGSVATEAPQPVIDPSDTRPDQSIRQLRRGWPYTLDFGLREGA
jgi:hypothetical protein